MDSGLWRLEIREQHGGRGQGRSFLAFHGGGRGCRAERIGCEFRQCYCHHHVYLQFIEHQDCHNFTRRATFARECGIPPLWSATALDAQGNPISGTAIITATAAGVTSGPVTVAVHPSITSVTIDPVTQPCFSIAQTHQFVAHAFHNSTEITNQIGNFTWSASSPSVASVDANGLATARTPGITAVVASVGSTTSPAVFFKSCMPVLIVLHINGDPAGVPTESAVMNVADTQDDPGGYVRRTGSGNAKRSGDNSEQ